MKNLHFFKVANPEDLRLRDWLPSVDRTQFYTIVSVGPYGVLIGKIVCMDCQLDILSDHCL